MSRQNKQPEPALDPRQELLQAGNPETEWVGDVPEVCQYCLKKLHGVFVDGKLVHTSSWAILCVECHTANGIGLGTGKGQKYENIFGSWVCVEGT